MHPPTSCFPLVEKVRERTQTPLVFLTYINPIYTYGKERFLRRCRETGVDGLIVPDLPFEEKGEILPECEKYGVDLISLIAPTSHERIAMIAKEAQGFIYCVSSLGVTGVRSELGADIGEMVKLARQEAKVPCAVGFGISTPEQAAKMAALSDGAHRGKRHCEAGGGIWRKQRGTGGGLCAPDEGSGERLLSRGTRPAGTQQLPVWEKMGNKEAEAVRIVKFL